MLQTNWIIRSICCLKTARVVSIDSLRYPFPTKDKIPLLGLRAMDTKPDDGVLPKQGAKIVSIKNAKHNDMHDVASDEVKRNILNEIFDFFKNAH